MTTTTQPVPEQIADACQILEDVAEDRRGKLADLEKDRQQVLAEFHAAVDVLRQARTRAHLEAKTAVGKRLERLNGQRMLLVNDLDSREAGAKKTIRRYNAPVLNAAIRRCRDASDELQRERESLKFDAVRFKEKAAIKRIAQIDKRRGELFDVGQSFLNLAEDPHAVSKVSAILEAAKLPPLTDEEMPTQ